MCEPGSHTPRRVTLRSLGVPISVWIEDRVTRGMLKLKEAQDGIVALDVSGKVTRRDTAVVFPVLEHLIQEQGTVRVLVELHDFKGWDHDALLSDLEFSIRYLSGLERLAVVGELGERSGSAKLTQPLFARRIRLFNRSRVAAARQWLRGSARR